MSDDARPLAPRYRRRNHYVVAAMIGLVVGLLATAFRYALFSVESHRSSLLERLHTTMPTWGFLISIAIGALGGLIAGLLLRLSPQAGGSGIPHLKAVMLGMRELDYRRMIPVKFLGGVAGIGGGLSLGREGPTVQMGAGVAQAIASFLNVPAKVVPQLLSCGAGAGLAAAFNAPLAGVIFVIEELHRELSSRTFMGALIATVVATAVAEALSGQTPSFAIQGYPMLPLWALPGAAVVGALGGFIGVALNYGLLNVAHLTAHQKRLPRWSLPALMGIIVGAVAWWLPVAIGGGHSTAEAILGGTLAPSLLALTMLLGMRFIMLVLSYGTGAPGGIFAPMLLIGALGGTIFGRLIASAVPSLGANGQAFAVLGMAAVFTGSVRAPLTAIVLICELTANYEQLFALCITCLCAHGVAEALKAEPIYDALMEADLHRSGVTAMDEARTIYVGVQLGSALAGCTLRNASLPKGALITDIERSGRSITPLADVELLAGDHISVSISSERPEIALAVVDLCTQQDDTD